MTITVAVTGGIGAGKSTISGLLAARGAVVVDSDRLAREVVAVGTPGLSAVADQFGDQVLTRDGSLDRPALAQIVFSDPSARQRLEAITHPLVRARFVELRAAAPQGSVVVNDIPLLTTLEAAGSFNLVIGVTAPEAVRIRRLIDRGLSPVDAKARIDSQMGDAERRLLCDRWIDNGGSPAAARKHVDFQWSRLVEYAANVEAGRVAARGGPVLVPYDPAWPAAAARLTARIRHAVGSCRVDHIGSTAIENFPARDVIDLQLGIQDGADVGELSALLRKAGFPPDPGFQQDVPQLGGSDPADPAPWPEALHANADPGRAVNVHVRTLGSPGWLWALRFRDWLRADDDARADYLEAKRFLASASAADRSTAGYAAGKEEFFAAANFQSRAWADRIGWQPA